MAEFVNTSVGLINVAHILRVWPIAGPALRGEREPGPNDSGVQLVDGRTLTCEILGSVEWPSAPDVPAAKSDDEALRRALLRSVRY